MQAIAVHNYPLGHPSYGGAWHEEAISASQLARCYPVSVWGHKPIFSVAHSKQCICYADDVQNYSGSNIIIGSTSYVPGKRASKRAGALGSGLSLLDFFLPLSLTSFFNRCGSIRPDQLSRNAGPVLSPRSWRASLIFLIRSSSSGMAAIKIDCSCLKAVNRFFIRIR